MGTPERGELERGVGAPERALGAEPLAVAMAALALGAGLALAPIPAGGGPRPPGPVEVWATDRDGHALVGLDRGLFVVRRLSLRHPVEVEARSGGGAWVVSAEAGDPLGPHALLRLEPDGRVAARIGLGPVLDLARLEGSGDALLVEAPPSGAAIVSRVAADGGRTPLAAIPGATCAAGRGAAVLAGTSGGELVLLDSAAAGPALARAAAGGPVADLAPGALPGSWWVLALGPGGDAELALRDRGLRVLWRVPSGLRALHLIPVPGEERVWLADSTEPQARRFGPGGVLEVEAGPLPHTGLDRGVAWGAGVLLVAPGALLRLDSSGALLSSQGGFDFLVDADRLP